MFDVNSHQAALCDPEEECCLPFKICPVKHGHEEMTYGLLTYCSLPASLDGEGLDLITLLREKMVPYGGEWRSDYAHLVRLGHGSYYSQTLMPMVIGSLCIEAFDLERGT